MRYNSGAAMYEQLSDDWTSTTLRVRYAETDQMGVVYYANYFVWMELGRSELCRSIVDAIQYDLKARSGFDEVYAVAEEEVLSKMRERWQMVAEQKIRTWLAHQNRS